MNYTDRLGSVDAQGGGYPPGGWGPPGGPPPGSPPGGYGPPGSPPGGYGPPGSPPGGYGPPGSPPGGYGPPGSPPGGYGPPGSPPGGYGPPGSPPGGYGPPGSPPGGYYAPPGGFAPPPYQPGAPPPGSGPGFEPTEAIAFGWAAVSKDFAGVALPLAVAWFVMLLPNLVLSFVRGSVFAALSASGSVDPMALALVNGGGSLAIYLLTIVVQAFVLGGTVQFALRVARGEKPDFGVVFSGGRYFAPMLGATLLYSLGIFAGSLACILPGLFLAAVWSLYSAFVVDKGTGAVDALKASWQATAPHRTNVIVYALLSMVVGFAGALACCVGALLVSFPVVMIGNAYVYLKLIGEQPRLPST
ncbi:MAG TPA: hypothetical protein VFK05_15475 [Polyangiaceae bacterium]|nr:hypothetical protein [Polyangiaceae bacterium]